MCGLVNHQDMSAAQIYATYARPLASGLLLRDGETSPPERQEAWQNLIGLTQQAILDRQRCNGDCSRPLAFELDPILRKIGSRLAQVAKGLYLRAEAEENRIAIKFDGWLPAEKPTDAFTKKWKGLINTASGNQRHLPLPPRYRTSGFFAKFLGPWQ